MKPTTYDALGLNIGLTLRPASGSSSIRGVLGTYYTILYYTYLVVQPVLPSTPVTKVIEFQDRDFRAE